MISNPRFDAQQPISIMPQVSETQSLSNRVATGAMWMAGQTVASRGILFLSQLLLGWILARKDFGQIALVYTITSIATLISNPGVEEVLTQRQRHLRRWATPAFWLSLACSFVGMTVMITAAAAVVLVARRFENEAYGNPQIFWMVLILALGAPLNALAVVPLSTMRSQMRFARISGINFFEIVSQQILTVVLAYLGFGAYSFVIPMPIVAAARSTLLWLNARPQVRRQLQIHRWLPLIQSTGWLLGARMFWSTTQQGDAMLLGVIFASDVLVGEYFFGALLALQIVKVLNDNLVAVLMPALNSMHTDVARMEHATQRACRVLLTVMTPLALLQILLAEPAVRLVFPKDKWPSIPIVQVLSLAPMLYAFASPMAAMINAAGRFKAHFVLWTLAATSYFLIVAPCAMQYGTIGTAAGVVAWSWLAAVIYAVVGFRSARGAAILMRIAAPRLLSAGVAAAAAQPVLWLLPRSVLGDVLSIALTTPIVIGVYLVAIGLLDRAALDGLRDQFRNAAHVVSRILGNLVRKRPASDAR